MFPDLIIQKLDSYKEFQKWMSLKYSDIQITYIKRGLEPEKCGSSAKFQDYNSNAFSLTSDVVFEYLPFAFQKGVFEEYFIETKQQFNFNDNTLNNKEIINYIFTILN